ncbi:histidine-rich glycoprotein [Tribolium castaneum]|uniref:histidine-rich glycoprotein n=1 Tax=Tribolium castaneum TaxID=7070 RepID=UPI0030FEDBBD
MLFRLVLIFLPLIYAYKSEFGKEFDASRYSSGGEKASSGYLGQHQTHNGVQGHHDKENHQKHYAENQGHKKGYNHQDGYYADHHQGQKGRNGYHYEDHGKYAKGHSTKGHHNVHKLDEYKKNTDFFDENNDEGFEEKHGGYELSRAVAKGGHNAGGHVNKGHESGKYGVVGFAEKGAHFFNDQGHKKAQGHDGYYGNHAQFAKHGGQDGIKKFGFINSHVLQ